MEERTKVHVLEERVRNMEEHCSLRKQETDRRFDVLFEKVDMILNKIIDIERRLQNHLPNWASFLFAFYSAVLVGLLVKVVGK